MGFLAPAAFVAGGALLLALLATYVARARVAQMIDSIEPGQTLAIMSLDMQPRVVAPPSGDCRQLRASLATLEPTTQSANLAAAVSVAESLAEGHVDAQVIVVADGNLDRSEMPAACPLALRYVAVASSGAENLAVAV